jgi:hypothetical protein
MTTTFKKRQKEMKRMDKARSKAERRAQKKLEVREGPPVDEYATIDDLQPVLHTDTIISTDQE